LVPAVAGGIGAAFTGGVGVGGAVHFVCRDVLRLTRE
jgi:hypothetical protein